MNCEDCSLLLDDFVDGFVTDESSAAVREHLASCGRCADALAAAVELRDEIARLPRSITPPRDLWPGIAARIGDRRLVRGRFGPRSLMAAAAALLLVASVVMAYLIGRQQARTEVLQATTAAPALSRVVLASFEEIGVNDYAATRRQLVEVLQARKSELPPDTLKVVEANLRLIDRAMANIAVALEQDPGNALLQRQLISVYRQQVDLLQRAATLPSTV